MDRQFDYAQNVLLAVEFADAPRQFQGMPASYARFRRLAIPDVVRAFDESHSLFVQLLAGRSFKDVLERHMGYWEKRVSVGKQCFVHYASGPEDVIAAAFNRLKGDAGLLMLGVYHIEPRRRPTRTASRSATRPTTGHLGKRFPLTEESVFWFNFFPALSYLFEKTFGITSVQCTVRPLSPRSWSGRLPHWCARCGEFGEDDDDRLDEGP
jgi:hypothetical protein